MELKAMHKRAIFLLVVIGSSQSVFSVEGRQIKSVSKNAPKQIRKTDNSAIMEKEDDQLGASSCIPKAAQDHSASAGKKEVFPPPTPTKTLDFGDSVTAGYTDDFRPTTPGNSPGVGHSVAEDVEEKPGSINSTDGKHSIAGDKDDFGPTNPGHSPGVGHTFLSKNSKPNA